MNRAPFVRITARLARLRLFCALPAEYPANTEVEARERASADDSYNEQQVSVRCSEEQLLGKGCAPATRMVYLQIASGRITTKRQGHYSRGCYAAPEHSPMLLLPSFSSFTY